MLIIFKTGLVWFFLLKLVQLVSWPGCLPHWFLAYPLFFPFIKWQLKQHRGAKVRSWQRRCRNTRVVARFISIRNSCGVFRCFSNCSSFYASKGGFGLANECLISYYVLVNSYRIKIYEATAARKIQSWRMLCTKTKALLTFRSSVFVSLYYKGDNWSSTRNKDGSSRQRRCRNNESYCKICKYTTFLSHFSLLFKLQ